VPFAISPGDFEDITDMLVPELYGAGVTRPRTGPGHCAKSCSAPAAPGSPRRIRPCSIGLIRWRSSDCV
jgi:hypothetical protein